MYQFRNNQGRTVAFLSAILWSFRGTLRLSRVFVRCCNPLVRGNPPETSPGAERIIPAFRNLLSILCVL